MITIQFFFMDLHLGSYIVIEHYPIDFRIALIIDFLLIDIERKTTDQLR